MLVGDLETDNDARRLRRAGLPVAQITTGGTCHLDASMIARGLAALPFDGVRLLFIENVGNPFVRPHTLGEIAGITLLTRTEGEDKPLKYPPIFTSAHAVVLVGSRYRYRAGLRPRRGAGQHPPGRPASRGLFTLRPHGRGDGRLAELSERTDLFLTTMNTLLRPEPFRQLKAPSQSRGTKRATKGHAYRHLLIPEHGFDPFLPQMNTDSLNHHYQ